MKRPESCCDVGTHECQTRMPLLDPCNDDDYDEIEAGWDTLRGANGHEPAEAGLG